MARPLRIEFPGAIYHVTSRGDRRESIFDDDEDRQSFLTIVGRAMVRFDAKSALFLGDRLDTDILGANRAGIDSVLVLTGISKPKELLACSAESQPNYVIADLRELLVP